MKLLASLTALSLASLALSQSPLVVNPAGNGYGWNPPPTSHQFFFNLTVNNPVTLQALEAPVNNPLGTMGSLDVYLTNPGTTTYVGNTTNAAVWTRVSTGKITSKGSVGGFLGLSAQSCQQAIGGGGLVLQPGTYGVAIRYVGMSPLFVATPTNPNFTNADMTVSGGTLQYSAFTAAAPGLPAGFVSWSWWGKIVYAAGAVPHACNETSSYGTGCSTLSGSFYQEFQSTAATPNPAAAASAALQGRSLRLVPANGSYLVLPGTAVYVPPSGTAQNLPAVDEGETAVTLNIPFQYPGGFATQFFVHTNGIVSVGSNLPLPNAAPASAPEVTPFLNATNTAWWSWHNFNPAEPGSGLVSVDQVGTVIYVTWANVESYPATAVNRSTVQFQFDAVTGEINYVWQAIDATGNSGTLQWDDTLIGYSPGGLSPATAPINITTLAPFPLSPTERFPLLLSTTDKAILGTTVNLTTSQESIPGIGVNFLSTGGIPAPGFDLTVIGAPGCVALLDINLGVGNVISNIGLPGTSMTIAFPLPPVTATSLLGVTVYSQSIWLDAAINALGLTTSNAYLLLLGNF